MAVFTPKNSSLGMTIAIPGNPNAKNLGKAVDEIANKRISKELTKRGNPLEMKINKFATSVTRTSVSASYEKKVRDKYKNPRTVKFKEDSAKVAVTLFNKGELYRRCAIFIWRILVGTPIDESYDKEWVEDREKYERKIIGKRRGMSGHMENVWQATHVLEAVEHKVHHEADTHHLIEDWRFQLGGKSNSTIFSVADFPNINFNDQPSKATFDYIESVLKQKHKNKGFRTFLVTTVANEKKFQVLEYGGYTVHKRTGNKEEIDHSEHLAKGPDKLHGVVNGYSVQAPFGMVQLALLEWQVMQKQLSTKQNGDNIISGLKYFSKDIEEYYTSGKVNPISTTKDKKFHKSKIYQGEMFGISMQLYKGVGIRHDMRAALLEKDFFENDNHKSFRIKQEIELKKKREEKYKGVIVCNGDGSDLGVKISKSSNFDNLNNGTESGKAMAEYRNAQLAGLNSKLSDMGITRDKNHNGYMLKADNRMTSSGPKVRKYSSIEEYYDELWRNNIMQKFGFKDRYDTDIFIDVVMDRISPLLSKRSESLINSPAFAKYKEQYMSMKTMNERARLELYLLSFKNLSGADKNALLEDIDDCKNDLTVTFFEETEKISNKDLFYSQEVKVTLTPAMEIKPDSDEIKKASSSDIAKLEKAVEAVVKKSWIENVDFIKYKGAVIPLREDLDYIGDDDEDFAISEDENGKKWVWNGTKWVPWNPRMASNISDADISNFIRNV